MIYKKQGSLYILGTDGIWNHKNIGKAVVIICDQVFGEGCEGHTLAVATDNRRKSAIITLRTIKSQAHPPGSALIPVAHKNIFKPIGISGNQVGCNG